MTRTIVINTKQDMARFARAHEGKPFNWKCREGDGGTIIVEEPVDDAG